MKTVMIINSPIYINASEEDEEYLSPLGLGYIATYLEESGFSVEIVDCVKQRIGQQRIIDMINERSPDFVGINVFTQNYGVVKNIIEGIAFGIDLCIGGPAVKSIFDDILSWEVKNNLSIVIGEGELIISDILNGNCTDEPIKIIDNKKVYEVKSGSSYFPKEISSIRLDRKYLDDEIIINHYNEREASIITSRGCIYDCAFCGGARSLNTNVYPRIRNEESVTNEISELIESNPGLQSIRILDDLFLRSGKSIEIANRIFADFPNLNWRGMVHVESLKNSLDLIPLLKQSNCKELFIGIESGSQTIRKMINKKGSVEDILNVSRNILYNGIDLKGYFIYGFPEERQEDIDATFDVAKKIMDISKSTPGNFRTSVFKFRPYHGTVLFNEISSKGIEIPLCKYDEFSKPSKGRGQFSFSSGNYSDVTCEVLDMYIEKTQRLME